MYRTCRPTATVPYNPRLSRIAEKLSVRHILLPVVTRSHVDDQFGFISTGSITSALIFISSIMSPKCRRSVILCVV